MFKPRKYDNQNALLTPELLAQKEKLSKQAPTFGRIAPEGYKEEAKEFNAKMREIGATLLQVVEE